MSDLTDKVTHLIAEEAGSPKYRCALENGIPIMHPSWIIDSHRIWLRGDDVDVKQSVERYRLPPFNGIVLCITGIKEMHRRTEISSKVVAGGGKYVREIERPVRVTHLLCGNLIEGNSEKVHYAEKFNRLGEARIHIVWEDWFWDSLRFGGRFDEETYKVSNPRPPPRALPEAPLPGSCPTADDVTGASSELAHAQASAEQAAARAAKLHNQADEEEEIASVKRVPAVTLGLWESILKPRGFEVQQGRLVRSPSKSQYRPDTSYRREPSPSSRASKRGSLKAGDGEPNAPVSAISAFRKARSFAPAPQNALTPLSRQLFKRAPTAGANANAFGVRSPSLAFLGRSVGSVQAEGGISSDLPIASTSAVAGLSRAASVAPDHEMDAGMAEGVSESARELFKGKRIRALGEARCVSVRRAIEECGGTWVSPHDDDDRVDFTIVRLVSGSTLYRNEGDEEERVKYRSECWLEHCISEERICAPEEHIAFVPLPIPAPVPGTEDMMVSYSGLDQSEACWTRRLLRALGIEHAPNFSRRTTHLLCPSGMGAKADKAREWGTPIVDMEWLASIAHRGVVPSTLPPTAAENVTVDQNGDLDLPVVDYTGAPEVLMATQQPAKKSQGDLKAKGKGNAGMVDITNDPAPRSRSLSYYDPPLDEPQAGGEEHESFGVPSMLLDAPLPSDQPSTPRQHSKAPSPALQSDADAPPPRTQSDADQSSDAAIPDRLYEERVPLSESPSPMRMPGERTPTTPRRFVRQPTMELQQRITTLLGKRTAAQMETDIAAVRECERKDARDARFGKRPKPLDRSRSHISLSDSGTPGRMSPDLRSPMPAAPSRKGSVAPTPPPPLTPAPVPEPAPVLEPAPKPVSEPEPELELELELEPVPAPALPAPSKSTTTSAHVGDNSFVVRKVKGKSHVLYADPHQNGARTRLQQILDSEDGEDSPGASAATAGEVKMDVEEMTLAQLPDVVAAAASGSGSARRPAVRGGRRGRGRKGARS
ncbi:hypothetical protein BD413DRAFT_211081 [Trametes elegans]|nr:hypothetical protein BD413DRAFT_211081 [Trametes elegans]